MPRWTLVLVPAALCLAAAAQGGPDCPDALEGLITKIETEYPGFAEKTTDRRAYESFRAEMIARAEAAPDSLCLDVLREYLDYFRDPHLHVARTGDGREKPATRTYHDRIDRPLDALREQITHSDDPLEGVWRSPGYEVGIVAGDGEYRAFVIEADTTYWKPGEIKFRLYADGRADYYLRDHSRELLQDCENLIVDLRGNPGGTDQAYRRLLPYVCTHPVRTLGGEYLATPTLVDGLQDYLDQLPDEERHREDRRRITRMIEVLVPRLGEFVEVDSQAVHITEIETADPGPRSVAVLVDGRTGSAAESFVYKARQSRKVKILGTPTGGVLDYGSARWTDIGCEGYRLSIPTYRSRRLPDYPIDNIGLQPDVYLDATVDDPVAFARRYLEAG